MTTFVFTNDNNTTLASAISNVATSLTLAAGTGAGMPSPAAGQVFSLTIISATNPALYEITYCTARVGDVCTIVRGQEGTTALAWNAGDNAANLPTAAAFNGFGTSGGPFAALNGSAAEVFNVSNASTPTEAVALGQFSGTFGAYGTSGVAQLPGGLIIQWGFATVPGGAGSIFVPFYEAFPNGLMALTLGSDVLSANFHTHQGESASGFTLNAWTAGGGIPGTVESASYIALGF